MKSYLGIKKDVETLHPGMKFYNEHVFFNFGRMYSNMLFKVNVFEHNVNMNIMKHKTSL